MSGGEFAQQVMRIAVAQICRNKDFGNCDTAEGQAFDLLVDVVGKYIEKIGRLCRIYAEHDQRTESDLLDLLQAFDKLEPNRVDWHDLERLCREVPWQVPYTSGVPDFPVERRKRRAQYGNGDNRRTGALESEWAALKKARLGEHGVDGRENEHPAYVPSHFPSFPERHTYARTDVDATQRENDAKVILDRNLKEKRRVQNALAKIHASSEQASQASFGAFKEDDKPEAKAEAKAAEPTAAPSATAEVPLAFQ